MEPQNRNINEMQQRQSEAQIKKINERIHQNVTLLERKNKSPTTANLIMACLRNTFIMYNLTDSELESIRDRMFMCEVGEDVNVFSENDDGTCFFIVETGSLELRIEDALKRQIKPGQGFGQIALLYKSKRISTVKTIEECRLWAIDRTTFRETVEEVIIRDFQQNRKCLQSTRFFSGLTREQKDQIVASVLVKKFAKNQTIIKEGDPGSCFYYIKQGYASAYKGNKFIRKLLKGDTFGEQSLYYNTVRQLTVKADEQTLVLILSRDTLNKVMGDRVYEITFKNFIRWSLENSPHLERIQSSQVDLLIDQMKLSSYKANETIFRKGIMGFQKFVVVIEGQLKSLKNGAIVATKGSCLGEQFFFDENKFKTMDDEIVMNSYGVLAELLDYKIIEEMGLNKLSNKGMEEQDGVKEYFPKHKKKNDLMKVKLDNLRVVEKLTDGQFGPVLIVRDDKDIYCLKSFIKKQLDDYEVQDFINNEGQILQTISHPLINPLAIKFHTPSMAFYVTNYIEGLDLYSVMEEIGILSSQDSKFYAANIIAILQYLHSQSIISRDIKPQNFMVSKTGSLIMTNLSVAKKVRKQHKEWGRTYTIIGTPHYMAPDIILGRGYNNMVDLWSLGIMIYEFMCGYLPYGDHAEGAYEIYEDIMQNQLKFPEVFTDKKCRKLIEQLLSHNPESRLDGSFSRLKRHSWFEGINWKNIHEDQPSGHIPYKPIQKGNTIRKWKSSQGKPLRKHAITDFQHYPQQNIETSKKKWANFGLLIE